MQYQSDIKCRTNINLILFFCFWWYIDRQSFLTSRSNTTCERAETADFFDRGDKSGAHRNGWANSRRCVGRGREVRDKSLAVLRRPFRSLARPHQDTEGLALENTESWDHNAGGTCEERAVHHRGRRLEQQRRGARAAASNATSASAAAILYQFDWRSA